jgi:predicted PurR-regulated permease PerM
VGTIAALYFAREILIPFAFALTLTFLLTPVVALLQRLHIGRVVSVLATVVVSVAVAGGISWIIATSWLTSPISYPNIARTFAPGSKRFTSRRPGS